MIGKTLAHYQITEKLGEGGMGAVYRARDTHLDRDVALKILPKELSGDPERAARFEREARTLASLQHANIASIYGYEQAEGVRFLAMELVEGEDLAQRLARGPLPIADVVDIAAQIALGMEAAHERGIVHRDLKPANVRIDPSGAVKVLDFGLARAYTGDPDADPNLSQSPTITAAMTQVGTILGTAAYMSPEQARGKAIDKRSDIWSYGVILFEMLTGEQLYQGETVTDILGAIVHRTADLDALPAATPPGLRRLIQRCLTPDVSERLRDIGEARIALAHLDDAPATDRPGVEVTRGGGRLAWVLVLGLVVALALVSIRVFGPGPEPAVLQVSLALPPGHGAQTMGSRGGAMRISPDGGSVAMVVQTEGNSQIWIRSFDEPTGRPVPGTENGHRPFWSPDGRSLGFFQGTTMRRVAVDGGAPLTIAPAQDGRGAAWLEDGTIVYAPTPGSGLMVVPAGGGDPRPLTEAGRYTHREPRALGSGSDILFLENRSGGQWWICVGSTDRSDYDEIVATGGGAAFAQGHLLYLRGTTLVAQPFDPASRAFTGDVIPLVENVNRDVDYGVGAFDAAESGGLVYQAGLGSRAQLTIVDREGNPIRSVGDPGSYAQIELSPDGRTVAVVLDEADGSSDLWMLDLERGTRQRFTFTPQDAPMRRTVPLWTPDQSRLLYSLEADGEVGVYAKPVDGATEEVPVIEFPGEQLWAYDLSHDGRWILFGRESAATASAEDLWVHSLAGEGETRPLMQTPFDEWPASFSPDDRWIAFDSDESSVREIYVTSFPDARGKWQVSADGGRGPQWNDDGTELYFLGPDGWLMAVAVDGSGESFVFGTPERLFRGFAALGFNADYEVLDDGSRFLVVERSLQEIPMSLFLNWKTSLASR